MPVHEVIPEEEGDASSSRFPPPPPYRDDDEVDDTASLLAESESDDGDYDEGIKLRRRSVSGSKSKSKAKAKAPAPSHAAAYVPVVRNSGDIESYLDSITEAEQELLSSSRYDYEDGDGYDYEMGIADSDSDGDGYGTDMKRKKAMRKMSMVDGGPPRGWKAFWYSKTWCRALVVVIACLVLLIVGFVTFARYRKVPPPYYVSVTFLALMNLVDGDSVLAHRSRRSLVSYASRWNGQVLGR